MSSITFLKGSAQREDFNERLFFSTTQHTLSVEMCLAAINSIPYQERLCSSHVARRWGWSIGSMKIAKLLHDVCLLYYIKHPSFCLLVVTWLWDTGEEKEGKLVNPVYFTSFLISALPLVPLCVIDYTGPHGHPS